MRNVWLVVPFALLLAATPACTTPESEAAHAAVARGAVLVDVRTPEEFAAGHVEGAVNVPVDTLEARLAELGPPDTEVVVYCHSGGRSRYAATVLADAGFTRVIDLGPMRAW